MGQSEILKVLEKEDRPMSCKQITKKLDQSATTVSVTLAKLIKQNLVKKDDRNDNWLIPVYTIIKEVDDGN